MSNLSAIKAAIVEQLKSELATDAYKIDVRPALVSREDVGRLSFNAPAIFVGVVNIPRATQAPNPAQTECDVLFVATVVAKTRPDFDREDLALLLVQLIQDQVCRARSTWGLDDLQPATRFEARNAYSGDTDKGGLSMWHAFWLQTAYVDKPTADAVADFVQANINYYLDADGVATNDDGSDASDPDEIDAEDDVIIQEV